MTTKTTKALIGKAPVERFNVSMPTETADLLRYAGDGNLSAGIRAAAKMLPPMPVKRKRSKAA
jgi:hypothetical protein